MPSLTSSSGLVLGLGGIVVTFPRVSISQFHILSREVGLRAVTLKNRVPKQLRRLTDDEGRMGKEWGTRGKESDQGVESFLLAFNPLHSSSGEAKSNNSWPVWVLLMWGMRRCRCNWSYLCRCYCFRSHVDICLTHGVLIYHRISIELFSTHFDSFSRSPSIYTSFKNNKFHRRETKKKVVLKVSPAFVLLTNNGNYHQSNNHPLPILWRSLCGSLLPSTPYYTLLSTRLVLMVEPSKLAIFVIYLMSLFQYNKC